MEFPDWVKLKNTIPEKMAVLYYRRIIRLYELSQRNLSASLILSVGFSSIKTGSRWIIRLNT